MDKTALQKSFMEGWEKQCKTAKTDPANLIKKVAQYFNTPNSSSSYYRQGATPMGDINDYNAWSYIGNPQFSWRNPINSLLSQGTIRRIAKMDPRLAMQQSIRHQQQYGMEPGLMSTIGNKLTGLLSPEVAQVERSAWDKMKLRRQQAMRIADMGLQGKDYMAPYTQQMISSINPFYSKPS